jgi:ABC-type branched-subunit amino acid transport system substrate-binding protein
MAAAAINKANSTDPEAVLAAAKTLDFDGATGPIKLDADNERSVQEYLLGKIKDGIVTAL